MHGKFSAGLLIATVIWAESITITPGSGSKFSFDVYKSGLMSGKKHDFQFAKYSGQLDLDNASPANSKVTFTIDASSLQCFDEWSPAKGSIDKILKEASGPVLLVDKYPTIQFQSTRIVADSADNYSVNGTLSIRGITKPALVRVVRKATGGGAIYEGSAKVLMTDYGIKPPTAGLGTVGTKPEILVNFVLSASK